MMEYYLGGGLLRSGQIIIDASIWIAFGCFIAAIFRNMIGPEKTRALFGNNGRFGLLIGWAVGMLLPVCSLGVIPVVRELHRVGVKPGTIIAFGLTAPLFNPLSVLYGLSLSDPIAIVVFSGASMIIVTAMGAIWGQIFHRRLETSGDVESPDLAVGFRRSISLFHSASTELVSWSLVFICIGVLASATVAAFFPHGSLQGETEPDKVFAPAFMAVYVTPIYSTPLLAMSQIGGMFQHGNSVGAAFSLLVLGAGVNLGVLCWFGGAFGIRRVLLFLLLLVALTIGIAYALDKPLYPKGVDPSGHTHAFDIYTNPYHPVDVGFTNRFEVSLLNKAWGDIRQYNASRGMGGPYLLGILIAMGLCFRVAESTVDLKKWYQQNKQESKSSFDIVLPPWIIGVAACFCLVAASVFGTFVFYPDPYTLTDDLSSINAQCVVAAKTSDWEGVQKWVPYCDDLSRRLIVGTYLRSGSVSEFKRAKARVYREKLDELMHCVEAGQTEKANELGMEIHRSYLQLRRAFREK